VPIELDPVDHITAGAVGEPGERTFFLQGRKGERLVTLLVEKQQVQLLAASVVEILARIGREGGEGIPEEQMDLEEPVIPEWRVGRLSIGYEEDRDLLVLEAEELVPGDEDADEDDEDDEGAEGIGSLEFPEIEKLDPAEEVDLAAEPGRVRFWASRDQMLSLARHGAAVCAAGRPSCQFCGNPIDAEGHTCPAMNGHRNLSD
jgi:uncharacterized repeat protein (TIGR03847 family)